jgi:STE24 endopeptidase
MMNEDKASRYHRLKRRAQILSFLWGTGFLVGLEWSPASASLRDWAERLGSTIGPGAAFTSVAAYVIMLSLLSELGSFPLSFYTGYALERRYGLSREGFRGWLYDQAKAFAIVLVVGCVGVNILYFIIRLSPRFWWLPAGVAFAGLIAGLSTLAPVLLLPLFYTVKPLERESLRARLLSLAERSGARVIGAYAWGLGAKTTKANAALTGLGATRRILVSDTMLAEYSDEEIEVVLAHEIAHHLHGDIWKGLAFESGLVLAGFYAAARLLDVLAGAAGLRGPADIAGLPLLALAGGAVSTVMVPLAHAISRAHERSADRFAIDVTRNPGAFISAMRRLGAQNLAEEHPSRLVQWLFYSHPPIAERIAAARERERIVPPGSNRFASGG